MSLEIGGYMSIKIAASTCTIMFNCTYNTLEVFIVDNRHPVWGVPFASALCISTVEYSLFLCEVKLPS